MLIQCPIEEENRCKWTLLTLSVVLELVRVSEGHYVSTNPSNDVATSTEDGTRLWPDQQYLRSLELNSTFRVPHSQNCLTTHH